MTDRIVIEITGDLPDKGKHAIMADAETQADALAATMSEKHGIKLAATTRSVRPGKGKTITAAPPSQSAPETPPAAPTPEPPVIEHPTRHRGPQQAAE